MKAFITGGAGMVGSHLCDFLCDNTDWEIDIFIRWQEDLHNLNHLIPMINSNKRISIYYGDLRDEQSVSEAIKKSMPDYIFHLGAQSYPQTSFTNCRETYDSNIIGTDILCRSALTHVPNAVVHVCSSSEVFGRVPKEKLPIDESCSFHPASPYAISKIGTDMIGQYYAEAFGLNTQVTRMFTHTGPRRGDVFAESTFAKQIALIEDDRQSPEVMVGNLESLRTWADVRDAVRAYYMLVTVNPIPGATYNIGGQTTKSVREMLDTLISYSSMKDEISVTEDPERLRPIDADLQVPNTAKFEAHTGWKPEYTFEQTMQDLLNYWRERIKYENVLSR